MPHSPQTAPPRRPSWLWPVVVWTVWLVFALGVLPWLVQGIYERRFLGFLHNAISPERHDLAYYLEPCRRYALLGFGFVLATWGMARALAWPGFYRRFVESRSQQPAA